MSTSTELTNGVSQSYTKALLGLEVLCEALEFITESQDGLADFSESDLTNALIEVTTIETVSPLEQSSLIESARECWVDYGDQRDEWEDHPYGLAGWWVEEQLEIVLVGRKSLTSTRYEDYGQAETSAVELLLAFGGPTVRLTFDCFGGDGANPGAKLSVNWGENETTHPYLPQLARAVSSLLSDLGDF